MVITIKLWFFATFYPTTTSSFQESDGSSSPAMAATDKSPYSSRTYE